MVVVAAVVIHLARPDVKGIIVIVRIGCGGSGGAYRRENATISVCVWIWRANVKRKIRNRI